MPTSWAQQAAGFFAELEQQNEREWWQANKASYDAVIKPAFLELIEGISGFGPWRVYRPNNDTRFNAAKAPYKTFIGAVAERSDGVGAFVQMSAAGLLVGTGIPMPAPDQLRRLRSAIDDHSSGNSLLAAMEAVRATGSRVFGGRWEPLQRVPRGYPSDHPRADLLRWKGVEISDRPGLPAWLGRPGASSNVDELIERGRPLHDWLGRYVGASELSAEERFAPKRRPVTGS